MQIAHNIPAINVSRHGKNTRSRLSKSLEKLSSGYAINRSADNAAGLGISEKMRTQIFEMAVCQDNVSQGIQATNTADGALQEINDMLVRARELCVQAANGTYQEMDREQIEKEMNSLFDELDRITASTHYNEIPLLRWGGGTAALEEEVAELKKQMEEVIDPIGREYIENITPTGTLSEWGSLEMVDYPEQVFDKINNLPPDDSPLAAKPATLTLKLDDSITDYTDGKQLDGKSVTIGNTTFNLTYPTADGSLFPPTSYNTVTIANGDSVQDVLNKLVSRNNSYYYNSGVRLESAKLDAATGEVTFTTELQDYAYDLDTRDGVAGFVGEDADGERYNGVKISSKEEGNLGQVDGSFVTNNAFTGEAKAEVDFIMFIKDSYDADDIANLLQNRITISGMNPINFTTTGAGGSIKVSAGMTGAQMKTALENAFNSRGLTTSWTVNSTGGGATLYDVTATRNDLSGEPWSPPLYIEETVTSGTPPVITWDYKDVTTDQANISCFRTQEANSERGEKYEIKLPSSYNVPFSFSIRGSTYTFYDSSKPPKSDGYELYSYSGSLVDVNGKSQSEIADLVYGRIASYIGSAAAINRNGNTVTVSYKRADVQNNLTVTGAAGTLKFRKKISQSGGSAASEQVFYTDRAYFDREVSLPLELPLSGGGNVDLDKLSGTGFTLQGYSFEFRNGGDDINPDATDIDISGCVTVADVVAKMNTVLSGKINDSITSDAKVEVTAGGKIKISMMRNTNYSNSFTDGIHKYDGLFSSVGDSEISNEFSGGTLAGKPNTTIDFSSINSGNLDTLLGKGFRITCASCSGEFVNVVFAWNNNNGKIPESFEITDDDGVTRTIYNYVVELEKVSDGSAIVENIVEQLKPNMTHFTDVRIGEPPTTLIVEDRRIGDLPLDAQGREQRGKVLPGLYTNFTYEVTINEVYPDPAEAKPQKEIWPELDYDLEIAYKELPIYAGSKPTHQIIPIHIPDLSLMTLRLRPPEVALTTPKEANQWLYRVDKASIAISEVRGTFGADCNRLETAYTQLGNAAEQITAAESRIRDTNMAKEMLNFTRQQIMSQVSDAMMAQANGLPQGILSLLQ